MMVLLATGLGLSTPALAKVSKSAAKPVKEECRPPQQTPAQQLFEVFRDCADTPEMVRLPAGKFLMGELGDSGLTYERPIHEVSLPAFSIGRYEVTFLEWDECRVAGFCQKSPDDEGWGRGFRPVINVSWLDAQQYVTWLSRKTGQRYRLASEAEWEYAARAGTTTQFYWGDGAQTTCDYANTFDISGRSQRNWFWSVHCLDGYAYTSPVGSFPPNPWGLFDMHGNVWEWVQDCWHSDYTDAPIDGSAWVNGNNSDCGKRVNRGGGWGNHPRTMRAAKRDADAATGFGDAFGFRVVREETAGAPGAPPRGPQSAAP